jgi:hypothetical protein
MNREKKRWTKYRGLNGISMIKQQGRSQITSMIVRRSHRGSVPVDNDSSGSGSDREEVPSPTSLNSSGYPFRGPQLGRRRVNAGGRPLSNSASDNHITETLERGSVKEEPIVPSWLAISRHFATLIIFSGSSDDGSFIDYPWDDITLDSGEEAEEMKTTEQYALKWNIKVAEAGAVPIDVVNEVDDDPPIPHSVPFKYT